MPQLHEWMFYEVMWRAYARGLAYPFPWWVQQYFRHWSDTFDAGLFDSKEAAFASNANYRYWNMVGEPNQDLESLVGQAGEVEPVYDQYALGFFLFDPGDRSLYFPQLVGADGTGGALEQELEDGSFPIITTTYRSGLGIAVREKVFATQIAATDNRCFVLVRCAARLERQMPADAWLCLVVSPAGPTGFQRHDRAGRYRSDRRLGFLRYLPAESRVEVNATWGPSFDSPPAAFGTYGNHDSYDPEHYLAHNPFGDLARLGRLNAWSVATDEVAGLCHGVFAWPMRLTPQSPEFNLDVRLPVGNFVTVDDLAAMSAADADFLERCVRAGWAFRLFQSGSRVTVPAALREVEQQDTLCRSHLLILADEGAIHPGPTIYDSFWIRDSSVEGMACALVGLDDIAELQFGTHYPRAFNRTPERLGPVALDGFFGGEHEKNDREWDSNGQALWAIGRFDRVKGRGFAFGEGMFTPYVVDGARWLRDNRSEFGLLHSGWSAEHLGEKDKPHYWDDLWAVAGLWEAARLAERIGAPESLRAELWHAYRDVASCTAQSLRWVLAQQRQRGHWETFVPTGPADVGRLDSTMVGALAYFHPCRLYMGTKLGGDIDLAMRLTLETIWGHFVEGGLEHDAAWNCYGPYLTLQLAHSFLYLGDLERMDSLLDWARNNAGFARVKRGTEPGDSWQVVLGAWNEQHCYPVASDFARVPSGPWYMGDIPHGWACAEFILLFRDMLYFEADEDADRHLYIAPGLKPEWLDGGGTVRVENAPTVFGAHLDFSLTHDPASRRIDLDLSRTRLPGVRFVYPCRFGGGIASVSADGRTIDGVGRQAPLPAGTRYASITYTL